MGEQRIGVAISDPLRLTAQGLTNLSRVSWWSEFDKIIKNYDKIERIIVGLPLTTNAQQMEQRSATFRKLAQRLQGRYKCQVLLWDERYSTKAVERVLLAGGVKRKQRREIGDKLAASWILQGYLDYLQYKEVEAVKKH